MAGDYWAPVFARLLEDYEFLELVAADTSEKDLISWIKPNRTLFARCARFLKKNRVVDKPALLRELLAYARNDAALRKIILYTWVEKNPDSMRFTTLVADADAEKKLRAGNFGRPEKIAILARIDPREGVQSIYRRVLSEFATPELSESIVAAKNEESVASDKFSDKSEDGSGRDAAALLAALEERIAALESQTASYKNEMRQAKKKLEQQHAEILAQNRRLEESARQLKEANAEKKALEQELQGWRSRVDFLERQQQRVSPSVAGDEARVDYSEQLQALSEEAKSLRQALENRDASVRRLEKEKTELVTRQNSDTDKDRQIANLQARLAEVTKSADAVYRLAGQLMSTCKEADSSRIWLFLSISGRVIFVDSSMVSKTSLVREEFALLELDSDNQPLRLESLESDARREICGTLEAIGEDLFLSAESQHYPVMVEDAQRYQGDPVRGVWLPEFAGRTAGIYRIESLQTDEFARELRRTVDLKTLKSFFRVSWLNYQLFKGLLEQHAIDFSEQANGELSFLADYREVLEPLRMHTRICRVCDDDFCRRMAEKEVMARSPAADQACDFCGKKTVAEPTALKFDGQRVLIFGGDYVGSEYERVLATHDLNVEWHSGFKNLADCKNGLGRPDLVLVIVRQISHTLLRELTSVIERDGLPVLYSSRRGVSGVLFELARFFDKKYLRVK